MGFPDTDRWRLRVLSAVFDRPLECTHETGPSVVCLSTADWDAELWTNKQHLMSRLAARGVPVLYVDSLGLRTPSASSRDLTRIARRLASWHPWARPASDVDGLWRDSPLVLPFHRHSSVRRVNASLLRARMRRNQLRWGLKRSVLWTYTPAAVEMFDPVRHCALVYHCVDDLAAYPGVDREAFKEGERALVRLADICLASSRPLVRLLEAQGARDVRYWPNCADVQTFRPPARPRTRASPVIGFIGAVQEHKVDMELVVACALARPDWQFRLVGPVGIGLGKSAIGQRELPPNVLLPGPVPHGELGVAAAEFDVGIIPYVENDYTRHVFPMKVFEYLATGLPVVSTPLPSLVGEVEHVAFAHGPSEFVDQIQRALDLHTEAPEAREARSRYAQGFSWEARAEEAFALLKAL